MIPTANRHKYLADIFNASGIPEQRRLLIRTEQGTDISGAINIKATDTFNIQVWWNQGIDFAKSHGAEFVAVLNDDTKLNQGDLEILIQKLIFILLITTQFL